MGTSQDSGAQTGGYVLKFFEKYKNTHFLKTDHFSL